METIQKHLQVLYGQQEGNQAYARFLARLEASHAIPAGRSGWNPTHQDSFLITYPDQVWQEGEKPLETLLDFLKRYAQPAISSIHILPFFPSSSDDGFAISDYLKVDPSYGNWVDIQNLGKSFRLMFDAVVNHTSASHPWFEGYLSGDPQLDRYYIAVERKPDLTKVVRPRNLPLLTTYRTPQGDKQIWTTFSADQVDLNFENPKVLIEILVLIMFYISKGASLIRLDAIAYLWKEVGTNCIHRPQTYRIVEIIRAMLDELAPGVLLITETNVPHAQNISYFGDGTNLSHMVYNFTLPPLVLFMLQTGSSEAMNRWLADLSVPPGRVTFLNFLASHDGIGLNPLRDILTAEQIELVVQRIASLGGLVSYKSDRDGKQVPYELNINYFDALGQPGVQGEYAVQIDKFICAHAILFALKGIPGIYFHSLVGSQGWMEGVKQTGRNRTINRQKLKVDDLETELEKDDSIRSRIYTRLIDLLAVRASQPAFDPYGLQEVVSLNEGVFALLRYSGQTSRPILCLHNITNLAQSINMKDLLTKLGMDFTTDLITRHEIRRGPTEDLTLAPYQVSWLV